LDLKLDLETWEDIIYSTTIFIGNPPQKIRALFDTGSSKFWVAGDKVKGQYKVPHNYYDQSKSKSALVTTDQGSSQYGTG